VASAASGGIFQTFIEKYVKTMRLETGEPTADCRLQMTVT